MFLKPKKPLPTKTVEQLQYRLAHFHQMSSTATQEGRALVRQKIQQLNQQLDEKLIH